MAKFKTEKRKANVGERILITSATLTRGNYSNGDVCTVIGSYSGDVYVKEHPRAILSSEYEVIIAEQPSKPSKNERISLLESQVAELQAKVEAMQKLQTTIRNVTVNVPTDVNVSAFAKRIKERLAELTPTKLTPNEQRKAVIDRAKYFVAIQEPLTGRRVEYVVNAEKRTVVALIYRIAFFGERNGLYAKAIAKCAPDDVFNADIGKAIALGRALGLDVSEFENAVKPTEVVVGHKVIRKEDSYRGVMTVISDNVGSNYPKNETKLSTSKMIPSHILDDTEAQY